MKYGQVDDPCFWEGTATDDLKKKRKEGGSSVKPLSGRKDGARERGDKRGQIHLALLAKR